MRISFVALLAFAAAMPAFAQRQPVDVQVERGAKLYAARCASCHGDRLEGKTGLDLVGLGPAYRWIGQTAADLYQKVVLMPLGAPNSLAKNEYVDLTAFIIAQNGGKLGAPLTGDPSAQRQVAIGADEPGLAKATTLTRRDITAAIAGGPDRKSVV